MRQLLLPIAAFVYCNRQAPAAGGRRQAKDGNFQVPAGACTTERARELRQFSKIILFHFRRGSVL